MFSGPGEDYCIHEKSIMKPFVGPEGTGGYDICLMWYHGGWVALWLTQAPGFEKEWECELGSAV